MNSFPIPGGDLREMKPFLIVNTGLRRLGCGGRAAMGMDSPMFVRPFLSYHTRVPRTDTDIQTCGPTKVLRAISPTRFSLDDRSLPLPLLFTHYLTSTRLVYFTFSHQSICFAPNDHCGSIHSDGVGDGQAYPGCAGDMGDDPG